MSKIRRALYRLRKIAQQYNPGMVPGMPYGVSPYDPTMNAMAQQGVPGIMPYDPSLAAGAPQMPAGIQPYDPTMAAAPGMPPMSPYDQLAMAQQAQYGGMPPMSPYDQLAMAHHAQYGGIPSPVAVPSAVPIADMAQQAGLGMPASSVDELTNRFRQV